MTSNEHGFTAPARLTVIAVRHGSTDLTGAVLNGSGPQAADPDLNVAGQEQCERLRQQLAARGMLDELRWTVASPARRAASSARILTGTPAITDARLGEVDFGRWEGQRAQAVWLQEPELVARWRGDSRIPPPGGTSLAALAARVRNWREECHAQLSGGEQGLALVVAHASTVRVLVADALGLALEKASRIDVAPATAAIVSYWADGGASLQALISV